MARPGMVGEKVATYSESGILETVNQVGTDPQTNQPDWIVSKVSNGEVLIDGFGNRNEWIVNDVKFRTKYGVDPENPMLFKPKGNPQQFVQISDNISFQAPWGETMNIAKGGISMSQA